MDDLYKILGVDKKTDVSEIKRAYRKLAQKYHPDVSGKKDAETEKKFKEINQAYEVLSDPQKRAQYDQFGSVGNGPAGPGGFDFNGFDFGNFNGAFDFGSSFGDIFSSVFGRGTRRGSAGPERGDDIEIAINVSFEESVQGTEKPIEYSRLILCAHCKGKGAEPGSKIVTCHTCQGTGQQIRVQRTPLGQIQTATVCRTCEGSGEKADKKCAKCHGEGRTHERNRITVRIPAGIFDKAAIRLNGKGEIGRQGGEPGDLYVHIKVTPSREFERVKDDIHTTRKIHVLQAILGDEIQVKTIHGDAALKIPAGTPGGKVFELKGYGVPKVGAGTKGDHFIKIDVEIPTKLSKKDRELYEQLAKDAKLNIKPQSKGFFN